jgi:deoxyribose-phosphate aldolase
MQSARPSQAKDLAAFIDHTLLKPQATAADIQKLCEEALLHSFKAVCVNPVQVARASQLLTGSPILIASVIGFPLGASRTEVKVHEAKVALDDGASELDMVIRLDLILSHEAVDEAWLEVTRDIAAVVQAAGPRAVKVILETGLLTTALIARACRACEEAGATFVKTATGFLGRGASVEDVQLMRNSCSAKMQIKASGGIKTFAQAMALIDAGASRLGTSSGVAIVTGAIVTGAMTSTPESGY